jgi:hypothetical protein
MPSSLNGTGVTFNDGTQLNSANEAGGNYIQRTYTGPATWTKPAGLKAVKVTVVGGGGGGGGGRAGTVPGTGPYGSPVQIPTNLEAFHGGGAGAAILYVSSPSIPGPVAVTVGSGGTAGPAPGSLLSRTAGGAGGTSSFGSFVSATGGAGANTGTPGAGGAGTNGNLNIPGGSSATSGRFGGLNTSFMSTSSVGFAPGQGAGVAGSVYGGGGTGAFSFGGPNASPFTGGAGSVGVVIVEEFY